MNVDTVPDLHEPALLDAPAVTPELSVVMPCLNEAETLGTCIRKAQEAMWEHGIAGEVIVADNGSTDGSQAIAEGLGARVVQIPAKGYGNALQGGIEAARGRYVIMGDSDDSYDFSAIEPFYKKLREGHDLVMGNRFRGGIRPGAMPWKHRWFGNPALSAVSRLFFGCPVGDLFCGLRGFSKDAYGRMGLQTPGMEFAFEMVIRSTLLGLKITEVPTVLHPDGRSRPPHLRSFRDGWRTLRFMLLYTPLWLFFLPGLSLFGFGLLTSLWLLGGPRYVGEVRLDIHTLLVASFLCLLGFQLTVFGVFTKSYAVAEGIHPPSPMLDRLRRALSLEIGAVAGAGMTLVGMVLLGVAVWSWQQVAFGDLNAYVTMRQVIPAVVLMTLGVQTVFSSFFLSILGLRRKANGDRP